MGNKNEEKYVLTLKCCIIEILKDYGIDTTKAEDFTEKMADHFVGDFIALLVKQGYIKWAEKKEATE